jgi:hypothetical protein
MGNMRLSQNFSFWETSFACQAALNLPEKAGFRPLFPTLFPKPTGFWEKLEEHIVCGFGPALRPGLQRL